MDRNWEAEKYSLSKITISFLSKRIPVKDAEGGELGYTSPDAGIFVAHKHPQFDMLDEDRKRFFRKGVFTHELLHQIFTDFEYTTQLLNSLKPYERSAFKLMANVLEDPAIEYWAKTKLGGSLLRSLKFTIAHIYDQSPAIEKSENAFSQFINALIQLGDMGLVKGDFTFPEARETFLRVAPIFNNGVLEPNAKKRLLIAKEIMEMSRELWENMAKRGELEEASSDILESAGKSAMSGSGSGEDADPDRMSEDNKKALRRSATIKKLSRTLKKEGDANDKASINTSASIEDGKVENSANNITDGEKNDDCDIVEDESTAEHFSNEDCDFDDDVLSESDDFSEDKTMSHEDILEIATDIEKAIEEIKKEEAQDSRDTTQLMSMDLKGDKLVIPSRHILNRRAPSSKTCDDVYTSLVGEMVTGIRNTSKQIKKMITFAQEETDYATRGKLNVKRLNCGKVTPRVFDKIRVPSDAADLVIGVIIDLSGSMGGDRIANAKKCAIAIAEMCNALGVPVYIMGFTGECDGYKVVHEHFITWKNSKSDRLSLLNIRARCQNYDGPSIRYFTEIMRKKHAQHKLMIVISDGCPCASDYLGHSANKDTAMAIRDARKVCDVLGVAVGDNDTELLHSFYGGDFLHVSKPSDLFAGISVKLKKFVRKWIENDF